jgi:hypothetical protein
LAAVGNNTRDGGDSWDYTYVQGEIKERTGEKWSSKKTDRYPHTKPLNHQTL